MTPQETAALLQTYDNVLILTHRRPDGDTLGCAAALRRALHSLGKTAYLLHNPEITDQYQDYVQDLFPGEAFRPEKVVTVDIAARSLFPDNAKVYLEQVDLAIDHHPSYENFGKQSCVMPERAACGEIVYEILTHLCPITPEIALPLYVAVSTDTGCFVYSNTTANTHRVAAALMDTGIPFQSVNKRHFRTKTRKRLALEAAMMEGMQLFDQSRIVVMSIPRALMERLGATENDADDISSLAGLVEGTDCAITMRELGEDVWKISVRTGVRINATLACKKLGGGGHRAAAGCTVRGTLAQATEQIVAACLEAAEQ